MDDSRSWVVTAADGHAAATLVDALRDAGFEVDQALDEIGVITGRGTDAVAARVRAIPGVGDVSPDQPIDIGPPDAPDTW